MGDKTTVQQLMQTQTHTVGRNDPLTRVDELMQKYDIRHVPVLDDYGHPCGMISQRDIFRGAILRALGYGQRAENMMLEGTLAKEVMSNELLSCTGETSVAAAAAMMLEHKVGALAVVDGKRLAGLITESDLLRVVARSGE